MAKKNEVKKIAKNAINYEYGEIDSLEELNAKADELKAAGDKEGLDKLAKENGIDEDLADMYIQGILPELCPDLMTAAIGKLDVEIKSLSQKNSEVGAGIAEYMKQKAMEDDDIARAVRKRGKSLAEICDQVWKEAERRKNGNCAYIPPFEVFQMARAYYLKEE